MKKSEVNWINEIPDNWNIARLKSLFSSGKGLSITKENLTDSGVSVISYGQIHAKFNTGVSITSDLIRYVSIDYLQTNQSSLVNSGDFIFADTSEDLIGCGNCVYIDTGEPLFAGYHTIILKSRKAKNNKYFAYLFLTDSWRSQIRSRVSGVKLFSISQKILMDTTVIIPPKDVQASIVSFLDMKCAELNRILKKMKASIEEYKQLRQAVISHAVLNGLSDERPMKNSGIEWIGEIPKTWNIVKAGRIITSTQNGLTRRDLQKSEGHIVLKLRNITADGNISYEYQNRILLSTSELSAYRLRAGDLLFVRVNGSKSLVGKCAIFNDIGEPVAYNDHIIRVRMSSLCYNHYFLWYLLSSPGKSEIDLHTNTSAGQYTISGDGLRDINLVLPPVQEQREIADYLDEKCTQIDNIIAKKEKLITELEAYKKSLIYEYVTGKKEVG